MQHYIYDYAGERVMKGKGNYFAAGQMGAMSAEGWNLGDYTLYVNPYLVIDGNGQASKHYFSGSERITSRLDGYVDDFFALSVETDALLNTLIDRQVGDITEVSTQDTLPNLTILAETYNPSSVTSGSYFYHSDHLGSASFLTDGAGQAYQFIAYLPFGEAMAEQRSSSNAGNYNTPYRYTGQELDVETGLYYYGARYYDPRVSLFMSVDPLADQRSWVSPYNYVQNNPLNRVDPTGALDNPIYGEDGTFLGTDDRGLQGDAIVMNSASFTQGMSHSDAMAAGTTLSDACASNCISNGAYNKISSHHASLPSRPDYDGFVTITEGVQWARNNVGALSSPTPDNMLYIDASKLNFGDVTTADFASTGTSTPINLFSKNNLANSGLNTKLRATVYALGRVNMQLNNRTTGSVSIVNDFNLSSGRATDYDWNTGGSFMRRNFINAERYRTGLNNSHGFRAYYYGSGRVNSAPSSSSWTPPPVH